MRLLVGGYSGGRASASMRAAPSISTSAWPMPPWGMGIRLCEAGLVSASAHLAYASLSALMCLGVDQRYETVGDSMHVCRVGFAGWGQVALARIYGAYAV